MTQAVAVNGLIGERVRQHRTERGWTLDELSGRSGVSRRMLINIEHGEGNPSIATLLRLSDALGVGLPVLVDVERPRALTVTRAGQAPELWRGPSGGRALLVAGTEPPDVVELWDWTLHARRGAPHRGAQRRHPGAAARSRRPGRPARRGPHRAAVRRRLRGLRRRRRPRLRGSPRRDHTGQVRPHRVRAERRRRPLVTEHADVPSSGIGAADRRGRVAGRRPRSTPRCSTCGRTTGRCC